MKTLAAALLLTPLLLTAPFVARAATPDPAVAQKDYQSFCVKCHGADGHGDGPAAAGLHPKPADFADCSRFAQVTDQKLFEAIKNGGVAVGLSMAMPPWKAAFSDDEVQGLVNYVRTFCATK